jgi:glucose/arabinose dehydrogenase
MQALMIQAIPRTAAAGLAFFMAIAPAFAQDKTKPVMFGDMDYGPAFMYTVQARPKDNLVYKGLTVRLADGRVGAVFDMDLLRWAAVWRTDPAEANGKHGVLDLSHTNMTSYKGDALAVPAGEQMMYTGPPPGWAIDGDWSDPRPALLAAKVSGEADSEASVFAWKGGNGGAWGPLPKGRGHWLGHYLNGENVVLSYTVGGAHVLEMPGVVERKGAWLFTRTFEVGPHPQMLEVRLLDGGGDAKRADLGPGWQGYTLTERTDGDGAALGVAITTQLDGAKVEGVEINPTRPNRAGAVGMVAELKPSKEPRRLVVAIWSGDGDAHFLASISPGHTLSKSIDNPTPRWVEPVVTKGAVAPAAGKDAYVLDRITCPEDNPWHAWMRPTGFDFFEDGTSAAISTWNGDVWIVRGIDGDLDKLEWRRFATGLHEPLGVVVMSGLVHVIGRDQITRLHDLNHDGEADYYENLNNDGITWPRTMALTLHKDSAGNLYYIKNGNRVPGNVPLQGCIFRVPPDGSSLNVVATGFRSANGMSVSPVTGLLTIADQEGNWVPATRIDIIDPAPGNPVKFYGYRDHAHGMVPLKPPPEAHDPPDDYEQPMCWVPKSVDNSAGGQAWVTDDRWGPFNGQFVHLSYGHARLFLTFYETVKGHVQGGLVQFPVKFDTGVMRARFNPRDGQLYVLGMRGWQTDGPRDSGFYRVRYTGKPVHMPRMLNVTEKGVRITFTCKVDPKTAGDPDSYAVERWNYVYSAKYGSPEFSVKDPQKKGHDEVEVKSATVAPDGLSVFLGIPDIQPVMQQMVQFDIDGADGTPMRFELYHTIHALGE